MTSPADNSPNSVSKISYTDLIHEAVGKSPQEELSVSEWAEGAASVYLNDTLSGMALSLLARGIGSLGGCKSPDYGVSYNQTGCRVLDDTCPDGSDPANWFPDVDKDTYGLFGSDGHECYQTCTQPTDKDVISTDQGISYVDNTSDCDDSEKTTYPGASETAYDGIDQDCNESDLTDVDNDGYDSTDVTGGTDCDDNSDAIHPGAAETCNSIDDNCNGTVDEGVTSTYYTDADGDNYGDPATAVSICADAATGLVTNGDDCDDTNASVNPLATEICNGIDDDCDTLVDDADPSLDTSTGSFWYPDSDGNNLAIAGASVMACTQPSGYAASTNLVGWYPLDEGSGSQVIDSSGNGYNGTFGGATFPVWTGDSISGAWAVDFPVYDDNINIGFDSAFNFSSGDFTVSGWVKNPSGLSADAIQPILGKHRLETSDGYYPPNGYYLSSGVDSATFYVSGVTASTGSINDGNWHQVVGVYTSGGNVELYVDGNLKDSQVASSMYADNTPLIIGNVTGNDTDTTFNGKVDEVSIYNRALSADEVYESCNEYDSILCP